MVNIILRRNMGMKEAYLQHSVNGKQIVIVNTSMDTPLNLNSNLVQMS